MKQFKLYLILTILTLGTTFAFIANSQLSEEAKLKYDLDNALVTAHHSFLLAFSDTMDMLQQVSTYVANTPEIQKLFLTGKHAIEIEGGGKGGEKAQQLRTELYKQVIPGWQQMTQQFAVRQLHFHLGPGSTSYLRVHKPQKFGDNMDNVRYSIVVSNATAHPTKGFETGRVYSGIRGVSPVFQHNKARTKENHIGALEAGTSFSYLLEKLQRHSQFKYAILLTEAHLKANVWPEYLEKLHLNNPPIANLFIESSSRPEQLRQLLINNAKIAELLQQNSTQLFNTQDKRIAFRGFPLRDFNGQQHPELANAGYVFIWKSIEQESSLLEQRLQKQIVTALVIALFALLIAFFILQRFVKRFERKLVIEQKLNEKQRQLDSLMNSTGTGLIVTNAQGIVHSVNQPLIDLIGLKTPADLFNKDILTICIANNKQRDQNKLKQCLQEGIVTNYEMVFQHTNGKHVEVRINATTQQTDNGIIITALCENITQSKKDLLRSDLLEQLLLATLKTNDADSLLSQTLDLLIANDLLEINNQGAVFKTTATGNQLALIYNINLANPLQKQCAILPFGRCHCGIAAQSGEIQFANCINDDHHITFEGMHPHGHYAIPIKLKGKVVYVIMLHLYDGVEPDPDNIKFLNAITDILTITLTRLQSEALLKQSNNQLEDRVEQRTLELASAVEKANQANQAKSVFLANMSHELRTPLHGILSFARFGLDKEHVQKPEKIHKYFDRINVSAERLLTLLNDLLDLAKLEAGKMSIEKQDYDLRTLVESSITEQEAWLAEKSLTVNWLDSTAETKAHFDAARISQVLMNLLSNAIKFSPSNTQLHFSISQDTLINQQTKAKVPALRFTLEDEGMGIPENELDSVFDKFVQSSKTHTGVMGTGLGLAICAEIIDAHNGKIWASSAENKGAQFSFIIPI